MRKCGMSGTAVRLGVCAAVLSTLALVGCAHHMRAMGNEHTIVVPGRSTANDDPALASRKMTLMAARATVNHGFRFFRITGSTGPGGVPSIRPGADVTIKLYRVGEVDPKEPGVWDALAVSTGEVSNTSR